MNKVYDERDRIDKGDQLHKEVANVKEGLTGNNEVFKLVIMTSQICIYKDYDEIYRIENDIETDKLGIISSQSCIDKDYDERYQRDNDDDTKEKNAENDEEALTGDKEADKIDKIDRDDNNKSDERYQIPKKRKKRI